MENVDMVFSHIDRLDDYTYSYFNVKDRTFYVYCKHCKRFEKMGVLANCNYTYGYSHVFNYCSRYNDEAYENSFKTRGRAVTALDIPSFPNSKKKMRKQGESFLKYYTPEKMQILYKEYDDPYTTTSKHVKNLKVDVKYYVCPECNSRYEKHHVLNYEVRQPNPYEFCYGAQVFKEQGKNGLLLKISLLYHTYGIWHNHVITHRYRSKYVFNLATGNCYQIANKRIDGSNKTFRMAPITNVTYLGLDVSCSRHFYKELLRKAYEAAYEEKTKLLGHTPDAYEPNPAHVSFYNITCLNRFPNIDTQFISKIKFDIDDNWCSVYNKTYYKIKGNDDHWPETILKLFKVDQSNFNKKLIRQNVSPYQIQVVSKYIKHKDNIRKLCLLDTVFHDKDFDNDLFKDLVAKFGETVTVNKIAADRINIYTDTINMYRRIKNNNIDFPLVGTIREIHDNLSDMIHKLRTNNCPLAYSEEELKLQIIDNQEYYLLFAKDTHTLIDVGKAMRICVGSYGDRALAKLCNIIVLRNKQMEPLVCIELSGDCRQVKQAKFFGNSRLPEKEFNFVQEWIAKNKLEIETKDLAQPAIKEMEACIHPILVQREA